MVISRWQRIAGAAALAVSLVLASGAAQARMQQPRSGGPAIVSFRASTTSLSAGGGKVRLTVVVKRTRTCRFSSAPGLSGLPATESCTTGRASRTVRIPANTSAGAMSYRFSLLASGPGGKASAKPVTVVIREAAPGISGFAASPGDLPSAGGATVIAAKVQRSATCVLSVTPAVAGLPKTVACAAETAQRKVSIPVALPALAGNTAARYTFTLKVTGPGGTKSAVAAGTVWPAMKFSAPLAVDAPGGRLGPISCVTATFCMGVDLAGGYALQWNGTSWSRPVRFERGPYPDAGYLISLSCATPAFCVAADASGSAFTYNGKSWSGPANVPEPLVLPGGDIQRVLVQLFGRQLGHRDALRHR